MRICPPKYDRNIKLCGRLINIRENINPPVLLLTIKNVMTTPHFTLSSHLSFEATYTLLVGTNPNQSRFNLLYQYLAILRHFKSNIWTIPLRKLKWWVQIIIYCGRTLYLWPKYFKIRGLNRKCSDVLGIKCY